MSKWSIAKPEQHDNTQIAYMIWNWIQFKCIAQIALRFVFVFIFCVLFLFLFMRVFVNVYIIKIIIFR